MRAPQEQAVSATDLDRSIEAACRRIAPTWPLDQFIAVNPYWGFVDRPIATAADELAQLSGSQLLMPRGYFREQWKTGGFRREHLARAISQTGSPCTVETLVASLQDAAPALDRQLPLITDHLDARRDLRHSMAWRDFVTNQISQHCAAYFDRSQAIWGPDRRAGLYASWREQASRDHSSRLLMGLKGFGAEAGLLPTDARELIEEGARALGAPEENREAYLTALLLSVNGWASWCAYERWQARLARRDDDHLVELLAIRLAWEWLLARTHQDLEIDWLGPWRPSQGASAPPAARGHDWLLQRALEIAYQEPVAHGLTGGLSAAKPQAPAAQVVFCIDVRSEVFRRALESSGTHIQTLGFAGFFGLPVSYSPIGTAMTRPQLPGLLAPSLKVSEVAESHSLGEVIARKRRQALQWHRRWQEFRGSASSGFTFVESCGLLYAAKLARHSLPGEGESIPVEKTGLSTQDQKGLRFALSSDAGPDLQAQCDLAAAVLGAMGLREGFARVVLLAGHGSQSENNPHAGALDCGACGGQTGEINARVLAGVLNDRAVRIGLVARDVNIPDETVFLAGLHNTTTDEVTLYDMESVPATHRDDLAELATCLFAAGAKARAERARSLQLESQSDAGTLLRAMRRRANDWSQVRPEWGLANNAAFIVAPRERSKHLDLEGRAFLHDYRWQRDQGFGVLELIMTAPMLVTNWINMQYYASTVDNRRYGSGNKVLHNVVGGRLGVFEGNGGDLRIGLPWQSLHDGQRFMHAPLRLSVFIEAPAAAIDGVIARHETVRQLIVHEWLHLFRIDADRQGVEQYRQGQWRLVSPGVPPKQP